MLGGLETSNGACAASEAKLRMKQARRRWWTRLVTIASVLTVAAASLSLGFRFVLETMPGYRAQLEAYVAKNLGQPVRIGSMALAWRYFEPVLDLHEVVLLSPSDEAARIEVQRLSLGYSLLRLAGGHWGPSRVEAGGIVLDVDIAADGQVSLRGLPALAATTQTADATALSAELSQFDLIRLRDSTLRLHDARLAATSARPDAAASAVAALPFRLRVATIRRQDDRYRARAEFELPAAIAQRATLDAELSGHVLDARSWQGDWSLQVEALAGWPWLAAQLRPETELAITRGRLHLGGRIEAGALRSATLDVQAAELAAREAGQPRARLQDLALQARLSLGEDDSLRVEVDGATLRGAGGAWSPGRLSLLWSAPNADDAAGRAWQFEAERLRLEDLAPWLGLLRAVPASAVRIADLRGEASALHLRALPAGRDAAGTEQPATLDLSVQLHDGGLVAHDGEPGFSGLEGRLEGSMNGGRFVIGGSPLRVQAPTLFDEDVVIDALDGELAWQREADGWRLVADRLAVTLAGTAADGKAALRFPDAPGAVPELRLDLALRSADAAALKPLMPKTWGPNTRAWLTRALNRARVTEGALHIDAAMTPSTPDGRSTMPWRLDLAIVDGELAFAPDWPAATALAAQLHFHDHGLDITAEAGRLGAAQMSALKATIADFHSADLVLDGQLAGDGADFYRLLRASPLAQRLEGLLHTTEASGPVTARVHLRVPLDGPDPSVEARGEIQLNEAQLAVRGLDEPLRALRGTLAFGAGGISAETLGARLYQTEIKAQIRPEPGSADGVLSGSFRFDPAADEGLEAALLPVWLREALSGQTAMQLRLPFSGPDSGRLSLASDLRGIEIRLPLPVAKAADEALPLTLTLGSEGAVPLRLQLRAGDRLGAALRFAEVDGALRTRGVQLALGPGEPPKAEADGLVITGAPALLDIAAAAALFDAIDRAPASSSGPLPFTRAELSPARLQYDRYALGPTRLLATPLPGGGLHVQASGALEGSLDSVAEDAGSGRRLVARLQQAVLEALPPLPPAPPEPDENPRDSPFDPAAAPTLDLDCARLQIGTVGFGHLVLRTARVADGQRIEQLRLAGGSLEVDAEGSWLRRGREDGALAGSSAALEFKLASPEIGPVLQALGYAENLTAAEARFEGRLHWPRVPDGLELAQAEGGIQIEARRGHLRTVEPGAGRVLGLFNLYALPRRFLFDFSDVVSKGLAYDQIKGELKLAGGNAETEDLQITGPQARIRLDGRIGLAARDYDQRVTVTPDISSGVTLGATLLGGPIGGGIALVAQSLFGKPFNRLARFSYRVTGSWANPELIPEAAKTPEELLPPAKSADPIDAPGAPHG